MITQLTWAAEMVPTFPQLAAKSWILMDAVSGNVLVEGNSDQRLPPASLTKLMTAYIATMEIIRGQIGENDKVTVSENAWRTVGSRMFIKIGSQVTVSDLLHGIIIQSGNDASVALSEHIAGSEDAFVDLMNDTAGDLGMNNSNFINTTGLPSQDHYSSAHDIAILARAIIYDDPVRYTIYSQKEFFWNNIKQLNRNLLLWRDKAVDGLKTGYTDEAGYCIASSAIHDGQRLIAVVFGANSEQARAVETQKLLTYGFHFFEAHTFYHKATVLSRAKVWNGAPNQVTAGLADNLILTMPKGQLNNLVTSITMNSQLIAPIAKGDVIGKVEVISNNKVVHSVDLIALDAIDKGSIFRCVWNKINLLFYDLFN